MNFLRKLFGSKQSTITPGSNEPSRTVNHPNEVKVIGANLPEDIKTIVSNAKDTPWVNPKDVVQWIEGIKKTWGVSCQLLSLTEQQAKILAQQAPIDTRFHDINGQHQIKLSANSIFIHAYGSWLDLGYLMFFYHGKIYYVNVEPQLRLTEAIFNRTDDLSHMAKIMITLSHYIIHKQRETLLIRLEGNLVQN